MIRKNANSLAAPFGGACLGILLFAAVLAFNDIQRTDLESWIGTWGALVGGLGGALIAGGLAFGAAIWSVHNERQAAWISARKTAGRRLQYMSMLEILSLDNIASVLKKIDEDFLKDVVAQFGTIEELKRKLALRSAMDSLNYFDDAPTIGHALNAVNHVHISEYGLATLGPPDDWSYPKDVDRLIKVAAPIVTQLELASEACKRLVSHLDTQLGPIEGTLPELVILDSDVVEKND